MAAKRPLWTDLQRDLRIAVAHARKAADRAVALAGVMDADAREDRELAIGVLIHNCYGAIESVLEQLVTAIDGDRPVGGDYHSRLLTRAASAVEGLRPAIISAETLARLQALRSFRHAFRHAYGAYDYERAKANVALSVATIDAVEAEVTAFARAMGIAPD